jgi:predicted small secreted protein
MKNTVISIVIVSAIILAACQKSNMMNSLGVDTKKYEKELSQDYSNAEQFHNVLVTKNISTNVSASDHVARHSGNVTAILFDSDYYKMMFNRNDSLFSEHFFEFCKDMMQNSGMMSSTNGMMGNNGGMMGSNGGMMNGNTMGSKADKTKMMNYMDSLHLSTQTMMNLNFIKTDSLMHNQMTMCKMMTTQTDSIEYTLNKMQLLRKNHKILHNN